MTHEQELIYKEFMENYGAMLYEMSEQREYCEKIITNVFKKHIDSLLISEPNEQLLNLMEFANLFFEAGRRSEYC